MYEYTKRDNIRNEDIRDKVGATSIANKMREAKLRLFRHVKRRSIDAPVNRCKRLVMIGLRRGKSRPRKNWER